MRCAKRVLTPICHKNSNKRKGLTRSLSWRSHLKNVTLVSQKAIRNSHGNQGYLSYLARASGPNSSAWPFHHPHACATSSEAVLTAGRPPSFCKWSLQHTLAAIPAGLSLWSARDPHPRASWEPFLPHPDHREAGSRDVLSDHKASTPQKQGKVTFMAHLACTLGALYMHGF